MVKVKVGPEHVSRLRDGLMRQLLRARLEGRSEPEKLLEIGRGEFAEELIRQIPHLTVSAHDPALRTDADVVRPFPYPAHTFDAVFAEEVLVGFDHFYRLLGEIARVLRPGGVLFLWDLKARLHEWTVPELIGLLKPPPPPPPASPLDQATLSEKLHRVEAIPDSTVGVFTFKIAKTPVERMSIHRLRHAVYVEEMGWERDNPEHPGLEMDEMDPVSVLLGAYTSDGEAVSTIRLILPLGKNLPFQKYPGGVGVAPPAPERMAELSRFTTKKDFRRRGSDGLFAPLHDAAPSGESSAGVASERLLIVLGLFRLVFEVSGVLGLSHWFAHMEKRLAHSLKRLGLFFEEVGPEVVWPDCRRRLTYRGDIESMHHRCLAHSSELVELLTGRKALAPKPGGPV